MTAQVVFGIDVGGTTVKCGLFTAEGKLLDTWEIPTRTENRGSRILPDVAESVQAKIRERALQPDQILGLGRLRHRLRRCPARRRAHGR